MTYRNDPEIDRKKQDETVIEESVDEEVTVGTKKYYKCSNGVEYETLDKKDERESRISWERQRDKSLQECNALAATDFIALELGRSLVQLGCGRKTF